MRVDVVLAGIPFEVKEALRQMKTEATPIVNVSAETMIRNEIRCIQNSIGKRIVNDQFISILDARYSSSFSRLTPELTGRARNANTHKLTMKGKLTRAP